MTINILKILDVSVNKASQFLKPTINDSHIKIWGLIFEMVID